MLVNNKTVVKVILALDSPGLYILVCLNQSNNSNRKIRKVIRELLEPSSECKGLCLIQFLLM